MFGVNSGSNYLLEHIQCGEITKVVIVAFVKASHGEVEHTAQGVDICLLCIVLFLV